MCITSAFAASARLSPCCCAALAASTALLKPALWLEAILIILLYRGSSVYVDTPPLHSTLFDNRLIGVIAWQLHCPVSAVPVSLTQEGNACLGWLLQLSRVQCHMLMMHCSHARQ